LPEVWEEDKFSSELEFEWDDLYLARVRTGLIDIFEMSGTAIQVGLDEDGRFLASTEYQCWYVADKEKALRKLRKYLGR